MDLNELEYIKSSKKDSNGIESQTESIERVEENKEGPKGYIAKKILILSIVLSLLVGFIGGSIAGLYVGKQLFDKSNIIDNSDESMYSKYDYSKFVINESRNITIADLYLDDEERYYAMQLIGTEVTELKGLSSDDVEFSTSIFGDECYIIEFFEPDCNYCNKMIPVVDAYRKAENAYPVIGMSIKEGDITNFNKEGQNSYFLIQKDDKTNKLVDLIAWVPLFAYVKEGKIVYVTFGNMDGVEKFQENAAIAFE